jgi:hypothetical protein
MKIYKDIILFAFCFYIIKLGLSILYLYVGQKVLVMYQVVFPAKSNFMVLLLYIVTFALTYYIFTYKSFYVENSNKYNEEL